MSLQFLEEEFAKLLAINERFSKWEKKLNEKISNRKLISLKLFEAINRTPIDWHTIWIVSSIATFTLDNNIENFEHVLNESIQNGILTSFERKEMGYNLIDKDKTQIKFIKLTDFIPSLDENIKKILQSNQRYGHCHWYSIDIAKKIKISNKVVSGYCTVQSKKMPYPHTWIELKYKGIEWVLDCTMNEAMNKEGYYKLYNPQNTIEIDNTTLIEDLMLMERTSLRYKDIRLYLFHPNEAREVMQEEFEKYKACKTADFI